jgi:ABC-type sugar transport system ATPase subunit
MTLSDVRVVRGEETVLDRIDLEVERGERIGLVGLSGSGKSSLLRVIAGLDEPGAGTVTIGGEPVKGPRRDVTMVFQDDAVYEHLDVAGNLDFPLKVTSREAGPWLGQTADRFLIRGLLDRYPETLSAGQRHVVSAARALVRPEVEVVLLDEPMVGTDPHRRRLLVDTLLAHPDLTVVIATNDPIDVLRWADRAVVLAGGRAAQVASPIEAYRNPVSLEVAEVMGEINRIPAVVRRDGECRLEVGGSRILVDPVPADLEDGARVVMGVRPSSLEPAGEDVPFSQRLRATVGRVESTGAALRVYFGLGDAFGMGFVAEIQPGHHLAPGNRVDWRVATGSVGIFDPVRGRSLRSR